MDDAALDLLKGPSCKDRNRLVSFLKSICKHYASRWCIETGYETIEYHFPIQYQGYTPIRTCEYLQSRQSFLILYRVAQIKHIGATKPANWRPWEPKNKTKCRRFDAKDQRSFSYQDPFIGVIKRIAGSIFLSGIKLNIINLDMWLIGIFNATTNDQGIASVSIPLDKVGTYSIVIKFAGSGIYASIDSDQLGLINSIRVVDIPTLNEDDLMYIIIATGVIIIAGIVMNRAIIRPLLYQTARNAYANPPKTDRH